MGRGSPATMWCGSQPTSGTAQTRGLHGFGYAKKTRYLAGVWAPGRQAVARCGEAKQGSLTTRLRWLELVGLYALACSRANVCTGWSGALAPRRIECLRRRGSTRVNGTEICGSAKERAPWRRDRGVRAGEVVIWRRGCVRVSM
jgi:hypothetical protein